MDCPRCGLTNPGSTLRCDCGFDFSTHTMENSLLHSDERVPENPSNNLSAKIPGIRETSYDKSSPWGRFKGKWGTGWLLLGYMFFSQRSSQSYNALGTTGAVLQILGFAACIAIYFFLRRRLLLKMENYGAASLVSGIISYGVIWLTLFAIGQSLHSDITRTNLSPARQSNSPNTISSSPQQREASSPNYDQALLTAKTDESLSKKGTSSGSMPVNPKSASQTGRDNREGQAQGESSESRGKTTSGSREKGETAVMKAKSIHSKLSYARIQLGLDDGDLDCAGWGLQEALSIDPDNTEAADLLKEVIARIDRVFESGDRMPILCHTVLRRESPSPYVRAMEAGRLGKKTVIKGHTYCAWCGRDITNESTMFLAVGDSVLLFCDAKPYKGTPKTPEQLKEFMHPEPSKCRESWEAQYRSNH